MKAFTGYNFCTYSLSFLYLNQLTSIIMMMMTDLINRGNHSEPGSSNDIDHTFVDFLTFPAGASMSHRQTARLGYIPSS